MSREALWAYYRDDDVPLYQHAADSELEVLMQEAPSGVYGANGVVDTTRLVREDTDLSDTVFSVMEELLTEREQFVLNAWVFERLGVRAIGDRMSLSKSQVWRIKESAVAKLRLTLSSSPAVKLWLEGLPGFQVETIVVEDES